jgi:hypothetical protein
LDATDYPNLIKQGERVTTIAVPTALVAFNWPVKSNRFTCVARFVDNLFSRIENFAGTRLRREVEIDQSRGHRSWSRALPGGAGVARSPAARNASMQ